MSSVKMNISYQADNEILTLLEKIAQLENKQLQVIIDEALSEYIERKQKTVLRSHVRTALNNSLHEFDDLYRELAK